MAVYVGGPSVFDAISSFSVTPSTANQSPEPATNYSLATKWELQSHEPVYLDATLTAAKKGQYIGLANHNLGTQGITIAVYSKSSGGGAWVERLATTTIADDKVKFIKLDSEATHTYWRVVFTGDCIDAYIGQISIGEYFGGDLALSAPLQAAFLMDANEAYIGASKTQYLGKKTRQHPVKINIRVKNVPRAGFEVYGLLFGDLVTKRPFFLAWDYENYPDEALYCWTDKPIKPPKYSDIKYMDWDIKALGVR